MTFKKPNRYVSRLVVHCSASDNPEHDNIKTIDRWHRERGMNGIGYHVFIDKLGNRHYGRSMEKTPAAQKGHNTGSIAVCVSGLKDFTSASLDELNKFSDEVQAELPTLTFHGHNEYSNKSCPVFDYRRVLGLNKKGVRTTHDVYDKPLVKSRTMRNATVAGVTGTALAAAPLVEPAGKVVETVQENPQGFIIVVAVALVLFAGIAIYLKLDDRCKTRDLVGRG